MKILLLNQDWFASAFRDAGHEVHCIGFGANTDVIRKEPLSSFKDILPPGFQPDLVIVHDNSAAIQVIGLNELECPIVFYAVDTHLHTDFHCYLSLGFNHTFIAQKDYVNEFAKLNFDLPTWLPLWAGTHVEPSTRKDFEASFVGTLDPAINPSRVKFFDELKKLVDVYTTSGEYPKIFPFSKIVVNQTMRSDFNFRIFEAMMCGAALVTEEIDHGLRDLFIPDEHLVLYERNNAFDAAEKIRALLSDDKKLRRIAAAGREEVLLNHTAKKRAESVLSMIPSFKEKKRRLKYFPWMYNFALLSTQIDNKTSWYYSKAVEESIKMLDAGLAHREPLNDHLAFFAIRVCHHFDLLSKKGLGNKLLRALFEAYPNCSLLHIAQMKNHLEAGELEAAQTISKGLYGARDAAETTKLVTKNINAILAWPQ